MLSLLHSSIPSLSPRILTTTPTLASIFARTFLTSSNWQEAAVPAKKGLLTKAKLEKLGLDESLLPPKKPAYAFVSFYNDFQKSQTTPKPILETSKEAAKVWRGMSNAEKKAYQDRAAKEHAEYRTKYQEWVNSVHPSVIAKINSLRRETGRRMVNSVRSDGINKPVHPYVQFVREFHAKFAEEHGKMSKESFGTYSKLASEAWKNLSEAERNAYRERYQKEIAEYLPKMDKLKLKTANSETQKPSTSAAKKNETAKSKTRSTIKKPSSPYSTFKNNFQKKYIKEHGEASEEVLAQLAKDSWRKLSTGRKNGYKKRYETKKAEYLAKKNKDKLN